MTSTNAFILSRGGASLASGWVCLLLSALIVSARAAEPLVTNVRADQVAGTKRVEVQYDLSGASSPVFVSLEASSDGGATFAVPVATFSGDVGAGIAVGKNRKIVWNAGADWNNQFGDSMRFRVAATDVLPAAPVLTSPLHNSTKYYNAPANPRHTFVWQEVTGADSYRLVVKSRGIVVVDEVVEETTFTPDMDLRTVTWQVYARRHGVSGPSSPVWTAKVVVFIGIGES